MFFPILLIVVGTILILAGFGWARLDPDDVARKIVVSLTQVMGLAVIGLGIVRLAERSAAGPPLPEDGTSSAVVTGPPRGKTRATIAAEGGAARRLAEAQARSEQAQRAAELMRDGPKDLTAPQPTSSAAPSPTNPFPFGRAPSSPTPTGTPDPATSGPPPTNGVPPPDGGNVPPATTTGGGNGSDPQTGGGTAGGPDRGPGATAGAGQSP